MNTLRGELLKWRNRRALRSLVDRMRLTSIAANTLGITAHDAATALRTFGIRLGEWDQRLFRS